MLNTIAVSRRGFLGAMGAAGAAAAAGLAANGQVEDVDFETVWGQGHTMAERAGTSTGNFIEWVNACCK